MKISKNSVVSIAYELRNGNEQGEVIELVNHNEPFVFLFNGGHLLPDFEQALEGMVAGDKFNFGIPAEKAYGIHDPESVAELPIDVFIIDGELATDMLKIGNLIPLRNEDGHILEGIIVQIEDDYVVMDFNHPLAGIDLYFTGRVLAVREATESEIAHGHVHGQGGVDHDHDHDH